MVRDRAQILADYADQVIANDGVMPPAIPEPFRSVFAEAFPIPDPVCIRFTAVTSDRSLTLVTSRPLPPALKMAYRSLPCER